MCERSMSDVHEPNRFNLHGAEGTSDVEDCECVVLLQCADAVGA
jgi:hypothetical protein